MHLNNIKHIRTTPYHPAFNAAAERLVRTFKQVMKAGQRDRFTSQHRLQNFLLTYSMLPLVRHPPSSFLEDTCSDKVRSTSTKPRTEGVQQAKQ